MLIVIFWIVVVLFGGFGVAVLVGAPYLPSFKTDVEVMLDLVEVKPGELVVDLGSGDGRVLLAAARRNAWACGYEINPLLWTVARVRALGLRRVEVKLADYWRVNLGEADVVFVFLLDRLMPRLERKLIKELKPGARLVSYVFALPNKKPVAKTRNAFLYRF